MLEFRSKRARLLLQVIVVLMVLPFAYPYIAMLMEANKGVGLVSNIGAVLARPELGPFFLSSGIIAAGTITISYAATMLASFALAVLRHRGKTVITVIMVASLTLPSVSLIIPLFYIINEVRLYDNYLAVILPLAILTVPFNVILTRSFIAAIPVEFFEAASIDGASTWQIFRHVVLPLCRPITAVIIVWTFVSAWNEYLLPLIFLQDPAKGTITLLPTFFISQYGTDQGKVIAASIVALVPTVVIYLLVQRFFERGITAGALK